MSIIENSLSDTHDLEEYGREVGAIPRLKALGDDWDKFYEEEIEHMATRREYPFDDGQDTEI